MRHSFTEIILIFTLAFLKDILVSSACIPSLTAADVQAFSKMQKRA